MKNYIPQAVATSQKSLFASFGNSLAPLPKVSSNLFFTTKQRRLEAANSKLTVMLLRGWIDFSFLLPAQKSAENCLTFRRVLSYQWSKPRRAKGSLALRQRARQQPQTITLWQKSIFCLKTTKDDVNKQLKMVWDPKWSFAMVWPQRSWLWREQHQFKQLSKKKGLVHDQKEARFSILF